MLQVVSYQTSVGELMLADGGSGLCLCDWTDSPHLLKNLDRMVRRFGPVHQIPPELLANPFAESIPASPAPSTSSPTPSPILLQAKKELDEYFAGTRRQFAVPLCFVGTPFQVRVWQALTTIPFGHTETYGEVARRIGVANAFQAVGTAIGRNPMSVIVPCHRVLSRIGFGGYATGLSRKLTLLHHESPQPQ